MATRTTTRQAPVETTPRPEPEPIGADDAVAELADRIAELVSAHPAVVRLDGESGVVASYLPGRRVVGVAVTESGAAVTVGVAVRLGRPLPEVAAELRHRVREVAGAVPVHVRIADLVTTDPATPR